MNEVPSPMTAQDCDLRDFTYMPLDVHRLLSSETWVLGNSDEKVAALQLWMAAWHQVPAGSLPNNDKMLAHLSGANGSWKRVREHAMRGWVLCSDGRLYHPVVAEKANEAWARKQAHRDRSRKGNAARWGSQSDPSRIAQGSPNDPQAIPEGLLNGSSNDPKGEGREREERKQAAARASSSEWTVGKLDLMTLPGITPASDTGGPTLNGVRLDVVLERVLDAAHLRANGSITPRFLAPLLGWLRDDIDTDEIVGAIRGVADRPGYEPPGSLAYFDGPVRQPRRH